MQLPYVEHRDGIALRKEKRGGRDKGGRGKRRGKLKKHNREMSLHSIGEGRLVGPRTWKELFLIR